MQEKTPKEPTASRLKRERHFCELLDLAADGNAAAVHDLWLQYQYDFSRRGRGDE